MITFTTCRACGDLLRVTDGDTVHPLCTPQPTKYERLVDEYVAALADDQDQQRIADLQRQVLDLEDAPPRLGEAALSYARWGWPVFPLLPTGAVNPRTGEVSDGKKPATRHGFRDATTDASRIATWWRAHPSHNVGLATGHRFDVVDVDPAHGGMDSYRTIVAAPDLNERGVDTGRRAIPDAHGKVGTGNGGWHFYVLPTGAGNKNQRTLLPGIDVRGIGGYVVAPPSELGDPEHRYRWLIHPSPVIRA